MEVAQGIPCLGPVTQSGCNAICPTFDRGCYGCFGPVVQSNCHSLTDQYLNMGVSTQTLLPLLRNFNASAPDFRDASNRIAAMEANVSDAINGAIQ